MRAIEEIIDNRESFRKRRDDAPVCRICGAKEIHSRVYDIPTMDCIRFLRAAISALESEIRGYEWERYPDRMGK